VENLFDTEYRDFLDTYKGYTLGRGRNVSFSLRIPFGI
jgi:iron complex outermembrane recepter protein